MEPPGLKRRLTCILCTDAYGYSRLVNEDETGALRILAAHRAVIDGIIAYHDGRIANTAGDSVLAEFGSVVEGVRCAVEIQDALKTRNEALPEAQRMLFRIGINLGEVVVKGNDLLGDGVNVAARLQSIAPPGGILVSSSVYDQITGKLDLGFQDMGEQELKNISRPIRAFSVTGAGQPLRKVTLGGEGATGRRPMPVIAVGALVLLAAGVGWQQGWIGAPQPPEVRVAAPDPVKAKLEAELAASERARAQAELRATALDADVIRARASADAAALRAKAETETTYMKAKAQSDATALQAKAQSDAAALRAQAQQDATRSKASDAQAIRARAETDAAALKANAEAEVAALKLKSEKDAAALKARSEKEAEAVKAKAHADIAAMPGTAEQDAEADRLSELAGKAWADAVLKEANVGKAAVASPAGSDASRSDGTWVMWQQCSANMNSGGFSRTADFTARGGSFVIERGTPGQAGHNIVRGGPSADGTLVLAGSGLGVNVGFARQFDIRLSGRWTGDRYVLRGHWGDRTCSAEVARK